MTETACCFQDSLLLQALFVASRTIYSKQLLCKSARTCKVCIAVITHKPNTPHELQSNGDEGRYWRVLSDAGITRQRLESFDRPIKTSPQFFKDKKVGSLLAACTRPSPAACA